MTQLRAWFLAVALCACTRPSSPSSALERSALLTGTAETALDRNTALGMAPGIQRAPAIASNGTGYVVVWEDARGPNSDVWSLVASSGGNFLGAAALVAGGPGDQSAPAVACGTSGCLAVWEDGPTRRIRGALLNSLGAPVASALNFFGSADGGTQVAPAIAFTGTSYLLAWDEVTPTDRDTYAGFVNGSGATLNTDATALDTRPGASRNPSIAISNVDQALVVWEAPVAAIWGARFTLGMRLPVDSAPLRISSGAMASILPALPVAAWTAAGNYRVVWSQLVNSQYDLYTTVVPSDVMTAVSVETALVATSGDQLRPALALASSSTVLTWADRAPGSTSDIFAATVGSTGALTPTSVISSAVGDQTAPALATVGTNVMVVWRDERSLDGLSDIWGAQTSVPGMTVTTPVLISSALSEQVRVRAAASPSGYFAAWEDSRRVGEGIDVWGTALDTEGRPVDAGVSLSSGAGPQAQIALASKGDGYLVVVADPAGHALRGRSISLNGSSLGERPLALGTGALLQPAVSWDGQKYWFVAFVDASGTGMQVLAGLRFDPQMGSTMPAAFPIPGKGGVPSQPAVDAVDNVVLVAWSERGANGNDIFAQRFAAGGSTLTMLDPSPLIVCSAPGDQLEPTVTHEEALRRFVVAWHDGRRGVAGTTDLYAARIGPQDGTRFDPDGRLISTGPAAEAHPTLGFDGTNITIAWEDHRSGTAEIYGNTIRPSDLAHRDDELLVAGQSPWLTHNAPGLLVYDRLDSRLDGGVRRAFAKTVLLPALSQCATDADCQSLSCSGGKCADFDGGWSLTIPLPVPDAGTDGGAALPDIAPNANLTAAVGAPYVYNGVGHVELLQGDLPVTFSPCKLTQLPDGMRLEPASGAVTWVPQLEGSFDVCFEAQNNAGISAPYAFQVKVTPDVAIDLKATVTAMPDTGGAPLTVAFTAAVTPADGEAARRWDFGDMTPWSTLHQPSHVYLMPGGYQAELTVFDRGGRAVTARTPIRVKDAQGHQPPIAVAQASAVHGVGSLDVHFTCLCDRGDGEIKLVQWDYGEDATFGPGRYRVGSSRVDLQACKLEYSIVSPK